MSWSVTPGDYVRVTEDVPDDAFSRRHREEHVYKFFVASVTKYVSHEPSSPTIITSGDGLSFSDMAGAMGPHLEVLEKALVPWKNGFRIRASLDQSYFEDEELMPDEAEVLRREVTLEPGSQPGQWSIVEHRVLLQDNRNTKFLNSMLQDGDAASAPSEEYEEPYEPDLEVPLSAVRAGRISAAPMEYFYSLVRRSWPRFAQPPDGWKGDAAAYALSADVTKFLTHVSNECWIGPENAVHNEQ